MFGTSSFLRTFFTSVSFPLPTKTIVLSGLTSLFIANQYIQQCNPTESPSLSSPQPHRDIPSIDASLHNHISTIQSTDPFQPLEIVGGHDGILTNRTYVLKPFTGIRGDAEANFYLQVWHPSRRHLPPAVFTPSFYGIYYHDRTHQSPFDTLDVSSSRISTTLGPPTSSSSSEPRNTVNMERKPDTVNNLLSEYITRYIMLEDLTRHYNSPSIMDIKIGVQTWDENASEQKIRTEKNKYPIQAKIGFRFTGMRVWDKASNTYREHGREYGYSLDDVTMTNAIAEFLYNGYEIRKDLIPRFITSLKRIENYFEKQNEFRFYGSSLLFIYEGNPSVPVRTNESGISTVINHPHETGQQPPLRTSISTATEQTLDVDSSISTDVRMIDFAHVWPIRDGPTGRDTGYLLGVRNLIHYFEAVNYGTGKVTGVSSKNRRSIRAP